MVLDTNGGSGDGGEGGISVGGDGGGDGAGYAVSHLW
jgi:hypothetical protein